MKTKEVVKTVGKVGVGIGVGKVLGTAVNVVMSATPMGTVMKVCVGLGTFAMGGMLGVQAEKYWDKCVDEVSELFGNNDEPKLEEVKVETVTEGV